MSIYAENVCDVCTLLKYVKNVTIAYLHKTEMHKRCVHCTGGNCVV